MGNATVRQGLQVALDVALENEASDIVELLQRMIDGELPHYEVHWRYEEDVGIARDVLEMDGFDPDLDVYVVLYVLGVRGGEVVDSLGGVVFHTVDDFVLGIHTVDEVSNMPNQYQRETSLEVLRESGWKDLDEVGNPEGRDRL